MKLYIAICHEYDPETEDGREENILGVFSTKELAQTAFNRRERRSSLEFGSYTVEHTCFQGDHEIMVRGLDEWAGEVKTISVKT